MDYKLLGIPFNSYGIPGPAEIYETWTVKPSSAQAYRSICRCDEYSPVCSCADVCSCGADDCECYDYCAFQDNWDYNYDNPNFKNPGQNQTVFVLWTPENSFEYSQNLLKLSAENGP